MSEQRTGRLEIAHKLRGLARDMDEIAGRMDRYNSLEHWALHAMQLVGAAGVAQAPVWQPGPGPVPVVMLAGHSSISIKAESTARSDNWKSCA